MKRLLFSIAALAVLSGGIAVGTVIALQTMPGLTNTLALAGRHAPSPQPGETPRALISVGSAVASAEAGPQALPAAAPAVRLAPEEAAPGGPEPGPSAPPGGAPQAAEGDAAPRPHPRPAALLAAPGVSSVAGPAADPIRIATAPCAPVAALTDLDGDFARNAELFGGGGLCVAEHAFTENGVGWVVHVVTRTDGLSGPLWAVTHDDEDVAFDTAVYGLSSYGGTMISVETGGNRLNEGIDPNRNFTGDARLCDRYSPVYTSFFASALDGQPILALHSNDLGSVSNGGEGLISIETPLAGTLPFRARQPIDSQSPEDTLVFLASTQPPGSDPLIDRRVAAINSGGLHVLRELVSPDRNDCSLSNYAVLSGLRDYVNLEVVHGDAAAQRRMTDLIMSVLR